MYKKTVELFLMDGLPNDRLVCHLTNWDGICYKIPKNKMRESSTRDDLQYTGIYMLFGELEDNKCVYIGEAENIYNRMMQHIDEDNWNEAVIFIRKENGLNKAYVKYMEHELYQIAKKANRYKLINSTVPSKSTISESQIAEMEEFMDQVKMVTNILGYKVFDKLIEKEQIKRENLLYINSKGISAKGIFTSQGLVVLKGSEIVGSYTKSTTPCFVEKGKKLKEEGIIKNNVFAKDYLFHTPSGAATAILGRNSNGLTEWKSEKGVTLKEILKQNGKKE